MRSCLPLGFAVLSGFAGFAGLAGFAAPLAAQKMGSVNAKAPTVTQSIRYADGATVKVSYFAITTAEGRTLSRLLDKERGRGMRTYFNRMADEQPLGSLSTSADLTLGGKSIKAGDYKLAFRIDENLAWSMTLSGKAGSVHSFDLKPGKSPMQMGRMSVMLMPGASAGEGTMAVTFSHLHTSFTMGGKSKSRPTSRRGSR